MFIKLLGMHAQAAVLQSAKVDALPCAVRLLAQMEQLLADRFAVQSERKVDRRKMFTEKSKVGHWAFS